MRNMGQSELADKLGVTRQTIHAVENGKFVPSTLQDENQERSRRVLP